MIHLAITDDHPIMIDGLMKTLQGQRDIVIENPGSLKASINT